MFDEEQGTNVPTDTDNATTFHAQDVPDTPRLDGTETKREHYKRLFTEYHTGQYNGQWGDQTKLRNRDNLAMFDAVSSQLELPQPLRDEGRKFLDNVNLREIGHPARLVVFCICARLHNKTADDDHRYHPNRNDENNPDRFLDLQDQLDLRYSDILSVFTKLRGDL